MEYLPWVLMALGLFLLFVANQRRASAPGSVGSVGISAEPSPVSRATGDKKFHVKVRTVDEAPILPAPPPPASRAHSSSVWMPIILSLLVTGAALVVILLPSYYGEAQQKWAFGVIGLILGYWFKK